MYDKHGSVRDEEALFSVSVIGLAEFVALDSIEWDHVTQRARSHTRFRAHDEVPDGKRAKVRDGR